jgi:transcriptional regulator GlxA family with amidase domain
MNTDANPTEPAESQRVVHASKAYGLARGPLKRALAFMEANLGERFSLQSLAEEAGVSRFHFARMFRIATGHSPMEYLMRQRIERSKAMLLSDAPSISNVAAVLGFCDQSHFSKTFRRIEGMSPSEFLRGTRS